MDSNQSLLSIGRSKSLLSAGRSQNLLSGGYAQNLPYKSCNQSVPSGSGSQSSLFLCHSHTFTAEKSFDNSDEVLNTTKLCCLKVSKP